MSAVPRQHSKSRDNHQEDKKTKKTVDSHSKLSRKHHRAVLMHN